MIFFIAGILIMFLLMLLGILLSSAFGIGTLVSLFPVMGNNVFDLIGSTVWNNAAQQWTLVAIPLFIFMGDIMFNTNIMKRLYDSLTVLMPQWIKGDLLQVNVVTCVIFAALSGSSTAGAACMGRMAYPELMKRGYDKKISLGSIACGGTLAILVPPSIGFIIYGFLTQVSVAKLFLAGVIPGLLLAILISLTIFVMVSLKPNLVPKGKNTEVTFRAKFTAFKNIVPFLVLIVVMLGSIYTGFATPTEAASVGVMGAILLALIFRTLTLKALKDSIGNTVIVTSFMFFIIIAAMVMQTSLAFYNIRALIPQFVALFPSPLFLYIGIMAMYFILGMVLDTSGLTLLTIPFVFPAMVAAGFDPLWFGVCYVIQIELALLTPPVGFNLFILMGAANVPFGIVARGTAPFLIAPLCMLLILYLWPELATWLPSMFQG